MRGPSRASLVEARDRLDSVLSGLSADDAMALGDELFAVLRVLDREHVLRRALSDSARPADQRGELASAVLDGKVSARTADFVADVVRLRWARSIDLTDAIERLAVIAVVASAEASGEFDDLEDELFRFDRIVEAQPQLRGVLADHRVTSERKAALLADLLKDKTTAATLRLVTEAATHARGRSLERVLAEFGRIVAERRDRLVAVVRTAVDLSEQQKTRLGAVLSAQYDRDVHLNIEVDPSVLGGISIRVGEEEIDGTIVRRLADIRRRIERAS
jgi:F-type H+-transporting ATPase subunit delta